MGLKVVGVAGFNASEDRRHDRRTLGLEELTKLIRAAHVGATYREMAGPARALCYRLAVTTGLRFSEIKSTTPASFALGDRPTVTVAAGDTKIGPAATLPLPRDLADDLAPYLGAIPPDVPAFPLPDHGADVLKVDLAAADISYRDDAGRVYDSHALRCQLATLADQAGVWPGVVQRLMRHSTLELTGRCTRPRAVDLEGAAASLPSLRPDSPGPEASAATGTDGRISQHLAHDLPTGGAGPGRLLAGTPRRRAMGWIGAKRTPRPG